ncbi:hypothetical protein NDU88_000321, partial [Pleurodeles waltl]
NRHSSSKASFHLSHNRHRTAAAKQACLSHRTGTARQHESKLPSLTKEAQQQSKLPSLTEETQQGSSKASFPLSQ